MFGRERETKEKNYFQIGKSILNEDDLSFSVTYKGDVFTLRLPNPAMQAMIETEVARRIGGYPLESYPQGHVDSVRAYCTIDVAYVPDKCPAWFKGPWICYDEELIVELYKGYLEFRLKFQEGLRSGQYERDRA